MIWFAWALAAAGEVITFGSHVGLKNTQFASSLASSDKYTYSGEEDYYVVGSVNKTSPLMLLPAAGESAGIGFPVPCDARVRFVFADSGRVLSFSRAKQGLLSRKPQLFASPDFDEAATFTLHCGGGGEQLQKGDKFALHLSGEDYLGTASRYRISGLTCPSCPVRSGYEYVTEPFHEPRQWTFDVLVGVASKGGEAVRTGTLQEERPRARAASENDEL